MIIIVCSKKIMNSKKEKKSLFFFTTCRSLCRHRCCHINARVITGVLQYYYKINIATRAALYNLQDVINTVVRKIHTMASSFIELCFCIMGSFV